jgi:hypothetical protein
MSRIFHRELRWYCAVPSVILALAWLTSCSPTVQQAQGPASQYAEAKEMFKQGNLDRSIDLTEALATVKPATAFTEKALVLRAVIFSGEVEAYKGIAEAYAKGGKSAKNPQYVADFDRRRDDALEFAGKRALDLGEADQGLLASGSLPKEITLDVPWPSVEGPEMLGEFMRVSQGIPLPDAERDTAAVEAQRKGIDDVLADIVGGDRSKARAEFTAGPVRVAGVDFAIFLTKQLLNGAKVFDRNHSDFPENLKALCGVGEQVAKSAQTLLKENPDKKKELAVRKVEEEIAALEKKG